MWGTETKEDDDEQQQAPPKFRNFFSFPENEESDQNSPFYQDNTNRSTKETNFHFWDEITPTGPNSLKSVFNSKNLETEELVE
jgi:hypothetical protein